MKYTWVFADSPPMSLFTAGGSTYTFWSLRFLYVLFVVPIVRPKTHMWPSQCWLLCLGGVSRAIFLGFTFDDLCACSVFKLAAKTSPEKTCSSLMILQHTQSLLTCRMTSSNRRSRGRDLQIFVAPAISLVCWTNLSRHDSALGIRVIFPRVNFPRRIHL